ncbi:hypothetical protein Pcinc_041744, partial [Petrolisthes cinctipes]
YATASLVGGVVYEGCWWGHGYIYSLVFWLQLPSQHISYTSVSLPRPHQSKCEGWTLE